MLMIIFGAGASYDSCPTYPPNVPINEKNGLKAEDEYGRPPLAKDLFSNRPQFRDILDKFHHCKGVVPKLRAGRVLTGEKPLEEVLQEIEIEVATYRRGSAELAAIKCYIHEAIQKTQLFWDVAMRGVSNYLTLLREVDRNNAKSEKIALITFNYDTLIEDALAKLDYRVDSMNAYTRNAASPFQLFKLHGSVNWGQEVNIEMPGPGRGSDDTLRFLNRKRKARALFGQNPSLPF